MENFFREAELLNAARVLNSNMSFNYKGIAQVLGNPTQVLAKVLPIYS
jgi:hypothetical protein